MKKSILLYIFIIILLFIINIFCIPSNVLAAKSGDINNDGKVGSTDYILIRKHILGTTILTDNQKKLADVDGDNKITSKDYIKIKQIVINGATSTPTSSPKPTSIASPKPTSTVNSEKTYIEVYFQNTINSVDYNISETTNDSFIIKTSTGKYILLDTGIKSDNIVKMIYDKFKELQKKEKITIDYLIISHMHSDHHGNAIDIMNNEKIKIKNLILKTEKNSKVDENLIDVADANDIKVIIANEEYKDGSVIPLDDYVKMYFFNVADLYSSNKNCSQSDYILAFTTKLSESSTTKEYVRTPDGKYIYFEGADYIKNNGNVKVKTTSKVDIKIDENNRVNSRVYLVMDKGGDKSGFCSSNGNSIAIVLQVKTSKGNRYIYLPNDLENDGYDPLGEKDSKYNIVIHGHTSKYNYKYKMVDGSPRFVVENNKLVANPNMNFAREPAEYLTAKKIVEKFSDFTTNLVVYQQAHHGLNNSKEALDVLNVNRKGVYTIAPIGTNPETTTTYLAVKTQYYLQNTTRKYTGYKKKNGIKCIIKNTGETKCTDY